MLQHKQTELEQRLKSERDRLDLVAARLQQIELEGQGNGNEVLMKPSGALPFASLRHVIPEARQTTALIEQLTAEVSTWLEWANVRPVGPWMALYPASDYRERDIPLEVGVAIDAEALRRKFAPNKSEVLLRLLPPVDHVACLVHTGPAESLSQTYTGLYAWIEANHMRVCGAAREVYLRDATLRDEPPAAVACSLAIEVQIPVEKPGEMGLQHNHQSSREINMKPTFVTKPAFNVVGMSYHGNNKNEEISVMWGQFLARMGEVERINPTLSYGICGMIAGLPEGHFEYVAGVEVADGAAVPDGMVLRRVPEHKYAVFSHHGSLAGLSQTYQNLNTLWMPEAGLKQSANFDMEVYTEEFDPDSPNSMLYLYTPIHQA